MLVRPIFDLFSVSRFCVFCGGKRLSRVTICACFWNVHGSRDTGLRAFERIVNGRR